LHARYVSRNKEHVSIHIKERRLRILGKSSRQIAKEAETFAIAKILPRLGFCEINHLSAINKFFPFDIIAILNGERVFIDVTTTWSKMIRRQRAIVDAIRMRVFILFIKPDLASYHITPAESDFASLRLSELRKVA
jgi:hypothetical protein